MKKGYLSIGLITAIYAGLITISSCTDEKVVENFITNDTTIYQVVDVGEVDIDTVNFESITPEFLTIQSDFSDVEISTLLSSEDVLPLSEDFVFGGSADGAGLIQVEDQYWYFINNEDNYAVSKIVLNSNLEPVYGEYVLNSTGAGTRLCSGTMAYPEIHGFGPLFITAGESGIESQSKMIDVMTASASSAGIPRPIPAFGRWNTENAVPLPKSTANSLGLGTMVVIGDDHSSGAFGQVAMYVSGGTGDLVNGYVYVLRRTNKNTVEMDMEEGTAYDVEFVWLPNAATLSGAQLDQLAADSSAISFGRVEDVDYRKSTDDEAGAGREVWFTVTGDDEDAEVYSKNGRVYQLVFDESDPTKGSLTCMLDGDKENGKAAQFHNPDNIMVTENYVYIEEDPNGYNRGSSPANGDEHAAYLYQYNMTTGDLKVVFEIDQKEAYSTTGNMDAGRWEYGSMIDVTDIVGASTSTFMLAVQAHEWKKEEFAGVDGGAIRPDENQGSQVVWVKGLGR